MKTRYKHDCFKCEYLGQYGEYDLYYCDKGIQTFIARYGDGGCDYVSGMNFATKDGIPELYEALKRKQRQDKLERITKN